MGYKAKRTVFRLKFEDPELNGLEVDVTGASVDELLTVTKLSDLADLAGGDLEMTQESLARVADAMERLDDLFRAFAKHLVAWNLEDDDEEGNTVPVPPTFEGVKSQDTEFILGIISAWLEAVGGVAGPKEPPSSSGKSSRSTELEESLPMAPLPESLLSSNTPSSYSAAASASGVFPVS